MTGCYANINIIIGRKSALGIEGGVVFAKAAVPFGKHGLNAVQRVWEDNPQNLVEKFIPMFLSGLRHLRPSVSTAAGS